MQPLNSSMPNQNPMLALNSSLNNRESMVSSNRGSTYSNVEDSAQTQFEATRTGHKSEHPIRRDTKTNKLEIHAPFDYKPD